MTPISKPDSTVEHFLLTSATAIPAARADAAADPEQEVLLLFDQCARRLHRYVGSFGLGAHDAEDIVQDVFLSLFRHLQLGRSRTNLKGWLFRVAHNLALKHRTRSHRRQADMEQHILVAASQSEPSTDPEEQLADSQRQRRLLSVLNALPERDRRCLYLRAEGLRYRDIASVLGMSLGAVSKSLTRSIAKLESADEL